MSEIDFKLDLSDSEEDEIAKEIRREVPGFEVRYSERKVVKILKRYLEDAGDLSNQQAVTLIDEMLPTEEEQVHLPGAVNALSELILEIATQIPYTHPGHLRLVEFLQYLQKSAKLNCIESIEGFNQCIAFEDFYINLYGYVTGPAEKDEDINMAAFAARLMASNITPGLKYPIWTMNMHLERELSDEIYNLCIKVSAVWILHAGQIIFEQMVKWPKRFDRDEEVLRGGPAYKGPIYGMQRWDFWLAAFVAAQDRQVATDETKMLAGKAADMMAAIVRNSI